MEGINMGLKIGITGAHGVGKTTLAEAISKELNINKIPELARVFDAMGNRGNKYLQEIMLNTQIEIEYWNNYFVSDRVSLDYIAYAGYYKYKLSSRFYRTALEHMRTYDAVFYIPIMFDIIDDGYRLCDKESQIEVDNIIHNYLDLYKFKNVHTIYRSSVQDRATEIKLVLGRRY